MHLSHSLIVFIHLSLMKCVELVCVKKNKIWRGPDIEPNID